MPAEHAGGRDVYVHVDIGERSQNPGRSGGGTPLTAVFPATSRLRVFKAGYVTQERDITALVGGTFVLQRQ
jgi:hypothetical protein